MNANSEDSVDATRSPQEHEPSKHQFLRIHGKTRSPPLKDRVIIYDCDKKSLEVRSKKEFDKGKLTKTHSQRADGSVWQQV